MKKTLFFILFVWAVFLYAQEESPTLYFEYDASGNQTVSALVCINCPEAKAAEQHSLGTMTYSPNPVKEQLVLTWKHTEDDRVTAVTVYTLSGRQVIAHKGLNRDTRLSLSFAKLPAGVYLVEVRSSNHRKKTVKIIKN